MAPTCPGVCVGDGTVLHDVITIWSGHRNAADKVEIIRILLDAGVNIHTVNRMGNNALDEAYISLSQVKMGSKHPYRQPGW